MSTVSLLGPEVLETRVEQLEAELGEARRTAKDLEAALDALPRTVLLGSVDRSTGEPVLVLRHANRFARRLIGRPHAEIVGRPVAEVMPGVAASGQLCRYLDAAVSGVAAQFTVEHFDGMLASGTFQVTVTPWGVEGIVVDSEDVTERETLQRFAETERRAGAGSWEWDLLTDELLWSDGMYDLHGVVRGPRPQLLALRGVPTADRARLRGAMAAGIAQGGTWTTTYRVRRPGHETVHLSAWTLVEHDADGRAVRMRGIERDVTAEVRRERVLTEQALTDTLTRVRNRRGWDSATTPAALAELAGPVAVAVLDLDHFKAWNDRLGHAAGDELLRECGRLWTGRLRSGDVIARIGGEEFAVLLPACGLAEAVFVLDDLRRAVPGGATASAGVSVLDAEGIDAALARADAALYVAKGTGRNRTVPA